ncbi:MAG: hypothetical protein OEW60_04395 [Thiovulaceae bacterium]|nr:hypothetical protein [Sulfurimonadaceae bacterium]
MNDEFEIQQLLEDLNKEENTLFFTLNEIRNILIDQRSLQQQEELLLSIIKNLDKKYHKDLLLNLATTSSASLNRLTLFQLQDLIASLHKKELDALKKQILSPLYQFPKDTKVAFSEFHLPLTINSKELLELLTSQQWQKVLLFEDEIRCIDDAYLKEHPEKFKEAGKKLDEHLTKTIHGEAIKLIEGKNISEVLSQNVLLAG